LHFILQHGLGPVSGTNGRCPPHPLRCGHASVATCSHGPGAPRRQGPSAGQTAVGPAHSREGGPVPPRVPMVRAPQGGWAHQQGKRPPGPPAPEKAVRCCHVSLVSGAAAWPADKHSERSQPICPHSIREGEACAPLSGQTGDDTPLTGQACASGSARTLPGQPARYRGAGQSHSAARMGGGYHDQPLTLGTVHCSHSAPTRRNNAASLRLHTTTAAGLPRHDGSNACSIRGYGQSRRERSPCPRHQMLCPGYEDTDPRLQAFSILLLFRRAHLSGPHTLYCSPFRL